MAIKRSDLDGLPASARKEVHRQIVEQTRKAGAGEPIPKAKGKYRNRKSEGWDSQAEKRYFEHLQILEGAGVIRNLRRQQVVHLHIGNRYMRIDFTYDEKRPDGSWLPVWDDYKGFGTKDWLVKADVWAAGFGPGLLRMTRWARGTGYTHPNEWTPCPTDDALRNILRAARATMSATALDELLKEEP